METALLNGASLPKFTARLKPKRIVFRLEQLGKCVLATLLLLAVFVSLLLSASPALHKHVHPDAAQASHQCAITIFQQQHFLASNPNLIIVQVNFDAPIALIASDDIVVSNFAYRHSTSRAPPSFRSSFV